MLTNVIGRSRKNTFFSKGSKIYSIVILCSWSFTNAHECHRKVSKNIIFFQIFINLFDCNLMFMIVQKCSRMSSEGREKILFFSKGSKIYSIVILCSWSFRNAHDCQRKVAKNNIFFQMFKNLFDCNLMFMIVYKCSRMSQEFHEKSHFFPNVQKFIRL